jgi:DNA-binding transcriptional regulator YdaS (Cro superfamily)
MSDLTKREGKVNRKTLSRLQVIEFRVHDVPVPAFDMRELFGQFIRELVDTSGETDAAFARATGIKAPLLSQMKPGARGRRGGTWKQIEQLVTSGVVTPSEVFSRLFDLAHVREHPNVAKLSEPKLGRDKLRQRLASAEIHERASSKAREPQKDGPPSRPGLSGRLQDRKTGARR